VEDLTPGTSPFCSVEFAGSQVPTSKAKNVDQHTFNECITLPVVTPVFEDIILFKLWNWNMMAADDLLAQGMLSFSKLRNAAMHPRWFNFYGYDPLEVRFQLVS
jgi:hypothetical protein